MYKKLILIWFASVIVSFVGAFAFYSQQKYPDNIFPFPLNALSRDFSEFLFLTLFNNTGLAQSNSDVYFYVHLSNAITFSLFVGILSLVVLLFIGIKNKKWLLQRLLILAWVKITQPNQSHTNTQESFVHKVRLGWGEPFEI